MSGAFLRTGRVRDVASNKLYFNLLQKLIWLNVRMHTSKMKERLPCQNYAYTEYLGWS